MAYKVRKTLEPLAYALVKAFNETREALVSTNVHYDVSEQGNQGDFRDPSHTALAVDAADATDETTLVVLVNQIKAVYTQHGEDAVAHKIADATNVITNADATNAATAITLVNEEKDIYEAHRASTTHHANADGTNTVTNADATNQATAITLANEIKDDVTAHILAALGGHSLRLVAP